MLQKFLLGCSLLMSVTFFAQEKKLSLDECITLAIENNLDLRRAELRAETSEIHFKQTRNAIFPSVNASASAGINNGRSIDPFTNAYIEEQLTYSNAGLGLDATVFDGFRIKNSIQRDRFNLQASEMEKEEARQGLVLDVTLAYLQILNNQELVRLANLRMETTSDQISRIKVLDDQGQGNPADYTDIQGQYAIDQTSLVRAQQALNESKLSLLQLINIEAEVIPETRLLEISPVIYSVSAEEIYKDALRNLPSFKARELRIEAAQKDVGVSKSLYAPEISIFAQLNTNYSSAATLYADKGSSLIETGGFVVIDNENFPVLIDEPQYLKREMPFQDQFNNNLSSVVGASLAIPLFNGLRAKNQVSLQKIKLQESKIELEDTKLKLKQSIRQAHLAMETAYKQYLILQKQVAAYEESFRVNEIRFNSGVSNMVAYIISKNNLEGATINLTNAKYEYLLRVKVLEYYRGDV